MPTVGSFWSFDVGLKSLWGSGAACGVPLPVAPEAKSKREEVLSETSGGVPSPCSAPAKHQPSGDLASHTAFVSLPVSDKMSVDSDLARSKEKDEAEEARREAARLREALKIAEEKLAKSIALQAADSPNRKVVRQSVGYFVQQEEVFEVLTDVPLASRSPCLPPPPWEVDNLSVTGPPGPMARGIRQNPVEVQVDYLSVTGPPGSMARGTRQNPVEMQVETMMSAPAGALAELRPSKQGEALQHSSSMRADEAPYRVRHVRCDNAQMPTALRSSPSGKAAPLKDVIVEPNEEVSVLDTKPELKDPNVVWAQVSCAKGVGWMKRLHLKEGGWRMRHMRTDNANIPTALRERPTATAKPLQAVKAIAHEEVLVHVQLEVLEGGRSITWARIACKLGEGWLKREHLKEVLPPGNNIEELPDDVSEPRSEAAPSSSRCETTVLCPPTAGGPPSTTQPCPLQSAVMPCTSPMESRSSPMGSRSSPMESKTSTVLDYPADSDAEEICSDYPASGVRICLGALHFVSNSVGSVGIFDTVSYRAVVQLGGSVTADGPQPRWIDNEPHTEAQILKFGRSISEKGHYESKICCQFDQAIDLPWPPVGRCLDKIAVDLWMERTSVVDHFDRVLGNLGLHSPAGIDRHWLGRAVADLPPEGCDDAPFAWEVEGSGSEKCPVPSTISVGVEWVYEAQEKI